MAKDMVQHFNRKLKESIQAISSSGRIYESVLLRALFTYRIACHRATNKTPPELTFGRPIQTKLKGANSFSPTDYPDQLERQYQYHATYAKSVAPIRQGTFVRLKKPLATKGQTKPTESIQIESVNGPGAHHPAD
ncbi:hypothetical protein FGIG_03628 [Fasciola gigantica]|uniref:Integrase catalytic domain-containing protein n=1 Tax=Fasciola gigantica TaxID=46835 RepID=A0A504YWW3_FASGI|nr:hypothetical protein FGIG_03628 [Fasciola gigantica]